MPHTYVDMLLPPAALGLIALALLLVGTARARAAGLAALALLVVLGQPWASDTMMSALEPDAATTSADAKPQAIVILSAEGVRLTRQRDDLEPGPLSLERIRAGAALARRTGLPILVSGGPVDGANTTLAGMMANSLRDDFRLATRWTEDRSVDTWQNAAFSAAILRRNHITRVYLVSHAWHLRRAAVAFQRAGIEVTTIPVRLVDYRFALNDLIPSSAAWYHSFIAMHEAVGLYYYEHRRDEPFVGDDQTQRHATNQAQR